MVMACDEHGRGAPSTAAGSVDTNSTSGGYVGEGDVIPLEKTSERPMEDPTTVRLKKRLRTNSEETALILTSLSQGFLTGGASRTVDTSTSCKPDSKLHHSDLNDSSCDEHEDNMGVESFDAMSRPGTGDRVPPRISSESNRVKSLVTKHISIDELRAHFDRPIIDVAKEFGICITLMKKICRRNGIKRWPHRQIRSLSKSIASMEAAMLSAQGAEREKYSSQITSLKQKREAVISDPNKENSSRVKTDHSIDVYTGTSSSPRAGLTHLNTALAIVTPATPLEPIERGASPSGSAKGGRWTSDEHASFLEGIRLYGKDWRRVAQVVGTRSAVQTRTHAQKYLLKFAGKFPFDADGVKEEQGEQKVSYSTGEDQKMTDASQVAVWHQQASVASSINGMARLLNNVSQQLVVPPLLRGPTGRQLQSTWEM